MWDENYGIMSKKLNEYSEFDNKLKILTGLNIEDIIKVSLKGNLHVKINDKMISLNKISSMVTNSNIDIDYLFNLF